MKNAVLKTNNFLKIILNNSSWLRHFFILHFFQLKKKKYIYFFKTINKYFCPHDHKEKSNYYNDNSKCCLQSSFQIFQIIIFKIKFTPNCQ